MKLLLAFTILTISAAFVSRADESDQQMPDIIAHTQFVCPLVVLLLQRNLLIVPGKERHKQP